MIQQSGQTPVKVVKVKHLSVCYSGYTKTDLTGEPSANNSSLLAQFIGFVLIQDSGQTPAFLSM
jgi:hypothetical protein